uniref:Uncharacterized protein n=1 Tax=Arundo donax TaxID=35708 RepID=A0A0A9HD05_ARUDO
MARLILGAPNVTAVRSDDQWLGFQLGLPEFANDFRTVRHIFWHSSRRIFDPWLRRCREN